MSHHNRSEILPVDPQFKHDVRRVTDPDRSGVTGCNIQELKKVEREIAACSDVPDQRNPHDLDPPYHNCQSAQIKGDCLIIWTEIDEKIKFIRAGSHAELF